MKLIVNSDDFGYSRGHNYGILDCYLAGVLKSTTLMNNVPGTEHAYALAKEHPGLDVGIHLVLTHGEPLAPAEKIPTLVTETGAFLSLAELREATVNPAEVYLEWSLQLAKQLENGIIPSHADCHHHVQMLPALFPVYCQLARENNFAIRYYKELILPEFEADFQTLSQDLRQPTIFRGDFYEENISVDYFLSLPLNEDVSVEVMAHPAYLDQRIHETSSYNLARVAETEVLTSVALKELLAKHQVSCISFKELT